MSDTLHLGALVFKVRRSTRRKSLGLTVERDGTLVVRAPLECSLETIEAFARARQGWVYGKLAEKEVLTAPVVARDFVPGEGFYYLGRRYRLQLVEEAGEPPLRLVQGQFWLQRAAQPEARTHFVAWYRAQAHPWLTERTARFTERLQVEPASVHVSDLGHRWASCGTGGRINYHWRAILLPPPIIDYLIVHELVHLHEPHHGPAFWQRIERALPEYEASKQWLAEQGAWYAL